MINSGRRSFQAKFISKDLPELSGIVVAVAVEAVVVVGEFVVDFDLVKSKAVVHFVGLVVHVVVGLFEPLIKIYN